MSLTYFRGLLLLPLFLSTPVIESRRGKHALIMLAEQRLPQRLREIVRNIFLCLYLLWEEYP